MQEPITKIESSNSSGPPSIIIGKFISPQPFGPIYAVQKISA